MFGKHRADVVVVGAGPVGLTTGLRLTQLGHSVQIIDKNERTSVHSYGLALHPRSLRVLDELGLATPLLEHGRRLDRVAFLDERTGLPRATVSYGELDGPFPFVLVLSQHSLELALEQALKKNKLGVLWNHRLQNFETDDDELLARIARLDQVPSGYPIARMEWIVARELETHCRFLVGADGYHSMVREQQRIETTTISGARTFLVFEFDDPVQPDNELRVLLGDARVSALWPMPERRARWSFEVTGTEGLERSLETLNSLIRARAPWFPAVKTNVHWSATVSFDRRLADRFGDGRVWLAGDAAHLTTPIGVQSLNLGLVEAFELADAIGAQLAGEADASALEEYGRRRREEWVSLIGPRPEVRAAAGTDAWACENAETIVACTPATGHDLRRVLQPIGLEYEVGVEA